MKHLAFILCFINEFIGLNLKVNLTNPKKKIFIEVRQEFTYIFTDIIGSKWGGLPIETQKKIIIMDEPTTHLDAERRKELVNILHSFFREGNRIIPQMLIITHHHEIENVADVIYNISKKEGFSTIATTDYG